jgi:cytochrome oxidase assembly protein ShyY1
MTEEQEQVIRELIRVARTASFTALGIWQITGRDSAVEAAIKDIETRLYEAAERANKVLNPVQHDTAERSALH